jgi:hypothetical protein
LENCVSMTPFLSAWTLDQEWQNPGMEKSLRLFLVGGTLIYDMMWHSIDERVTWTNRVLQTWR